MRKRLLALTLALLILSGCAVPSHSPELRRYEASFLTLFDTVTTIVGYAESEEAFETVAQDIHDELLAYHELFDIYHDYDGVNNIKTINDNAGGQPVKVDRRIIDLLLFCRELNQITNGTVDVTMGSVLSLWHQAREKGIEYPEEAALPEMAALEEAKNHTGFHLLEIDEENCTVRLADPQARLDVGAVAKGYAVQRVAENAPEGLLLSVGGNVTATGPKPMDESPWVVGVQNPDGNDYLHTLYVTDISVVTSGDYQRYFTVDGTVYHHIIDPETLMPGQKWRAVTVLCGDSGLADGLSTALFLMTQEEGTILLEKYGAEAMWIAPDGTKYYSGGFENAIRT